MNFPSFVNFTMRALFDLLRACPSATKMSPLAPMATPSAIEHVRSIAAHSRLPIVISSLPSGLILKTV